jgi:hypothetical protein
MLKVGRGAAVPPFMVMDVIAAANARQAVLGAGRAVIRMEVGQPGTGAPAGAVAAAMAALRDGLPMGYTEALGLASLRARIGLHYRDWYGVAVDPARVAVTVGASGAFPLAFLAAFDAWDRVAMASPFYPPYVNILTSLGMEPVLIEAGPETRFQPSIAALEKLSPRPQGLIVASPCNPAGTMLRPEELAAIGAWCAANGVRLISDEIYHGLHYDAPIATAAGIPGAVVINSFSKYFSMTGWRVGWMVLPEDLVRGVPGAEPYDLGAAYRAGGGRGGFRVRGGARCECRAVSAVARCAARRVAGFGAGARHTSGGGVLSLGGCLRAQQRFAGVLRAIAGGGGYRGLARGGFRPRARRSLCAVQLLRAGGGHGGGGGADRRVGARLSGARLSGVL